MCKNPNTVIADAKRVNNGGATYALYEKSTNELAGLCLIFSGAMGIAYNITDDDELDYYNKDSTKNWTNMFEFVRYLFHVEGGPSIVEKSIRDSYCVVPC